jgi:hypothetical protein
MKERESNRRMKKLDKEEMRSFYSSHNIIRVIKARRTGRARHEANTGEISSTYRILVENLKGRDNSEGLGVDGSAILRILKEIGCEGVGWIHLAQYRVQWRALVDTVMDFPIP